MAPLFRSSSLAPRPFGVQGPSSASLALLPSLTPLLGAFNPVRPAGDPLHSALSASRCQTGAWNLRGLSPRPLCLPPQNSISTCGSVTHPDTETHKKASLACPSFPESARLTRPLLPQDACLSAPHEALTPVPATSSAGAETIVTSRGQTLGDFSQGGLWLPGSTVTLTRQILTSHLENRVVGGIQDNTGPGNHAPRSPTPGWCTGMTQRDGLGRAVGGGSRRGTHVHPWLIHVTVWQKPLQYCKVISLQLPTKQS